MDTKGAFGTGALLVLALTGSATAQVTMRVSVATNGTEGNAGSAFHSLTPDGRYLSFASSASNFDGGDVNGVTDVFVRDRQSGTTERVSVSSAEVEGNGQSVNNSISADGRYVAFDSTASNLVLGDTNADGDVFVRDRLLGTTERVSLSSGGTEANDGSANARISADGRFVAFYSIASNLVPGDTNARADIFVRDLQNGTTERVSIATGGAQGNGNSEFSGISISDDGRFVAFTSFASNHVAGDTNSSDDVFVHDRQSGTTERVSVDSSGAEGNSASGSPSVSSDGRYVLFKSFASNLVAGDTNASSDVFLRDRQSSTTERVSVASGGAQGNGDSEVGYTTSISSDGRFVVFSGGASDLVSGDTNGVQDVFLRDRQSDTTERVSIDTGGGQGNAESRFPSISPDARYVAFKSFATNLIIGDTNGSQDVFLRDREGTPFASFCYPDLGGVRSCPCGNPPTAADRGCDSYINTSTTSGTGGAKLAASGTPSASVANTLVFHVTQAHNPGSNTNLHVFWKGNSTLAVGVKSGFGVRCVAGSLKRIYQGTGTGTGGLGSTNAVDFPNGTETTDAWTASQMPAAGTTLYYYDSFRDQQGPTTCNTANDRFNVSHAGALTWLP